MSLLTKIKAVSVGDFIDRGKEISATLYQKPKDNITYQEICCPSNTKVLKLSVLRKILNEV